MRAECDGRLRHRAGLHHGQALPHRGPRPALHRRLPANPLRRGHRPGPPARTKPQPERLRRARRPVRSSRVPRSHRAPQAKPTSDASSASTSSTTISSGIIRASTTRPSTLAPGPPTTTARCSGSGASASTRGARRSGSNFGTIRGCGSGVRRAGKISAGARVAPLRQGRVGRRYAAHAPCPPNRGSPQPSSAEVGSPAVRSVARAAPSGATPRRE